MCDGDLCGDSGGYAGNGVAGVPSRLGSGGLQHCWLDDAPCRPAGGERSRREPRHAWTAVGAQRLREARDLRARREREGDGPRVDFGRRTSRTGKRWRRPACGNGTCLYVADIGDNNAKRRDITIYRVPEPAKAGGSAQVDGVFRASYPDGAHDAEALLAAPDGTLYIVTKGDTGHVALYRFPRELRNGTTMRLERVGEPLSKGQPAADARITDGAISPDGEWVVLRTRTALMFYRAADFLKGNFREARRVDLKPLGEPQGEARRLRRRRTPVYVAGRRRRQIAARNSGGPVMRELTPRPALILVRGGGRLGSSPARARCAT